MLLATAGTIGACSSSSSNGNGSSGGGGGSANFCSELNSYVTACSATASACQKAEAQDCTSLSSSYNSAFLDALSACEPSSTSCSPEASDNSACVQAKIASLQPTAAQAKVKTDFCKVCPDGMSQFDPTPCSGFFSADGGFGVGSLILELSDSVASQVDTMCASGSGAGADAGPFNDCALLFDECALGVFQSAVHLPAACMTDSGVSTMSARVPLGFAR